MEWVETTASSVSEAKDLALDKLGVHDSDAVFEILEEPKKGFLGRTKGVARVRARIAPKAPPPKNDRQRRRGSKSNSSNKRRSKGGANAKGSAVAKGAAAAGGAAAAQGSKSSGEGEKSDGGNNRNRNRNRNRDSNKSQNNRNSKADQPKKEDIPVEQVVDRVEEFLGGLAGAFGVGGDVTTTLDGDNLLASLPTKEGLMIGPKGRTLDAIQELARVSAQRLGPTSARIKVDIGGYRESRKAALIAFASKAAATSIADGVEVVLEPMSSADRKVLHDALGEIDGVSTRSAGNEPRRRVVVVPDAPAASDNSEEE